MYTACSCLSVLAGADEQLGSTQLVWEHGCGKRASKTEISSWSTEGAAADVGAGKKGTENGGGGLVMISEDNGGGGGLVWAEVLECAAGDDDDDRNSNSTKWGSRFRWRLRGGRWTAEQVWEVLGDFCGMKRWVPALDCCRRVEYPEDGMNGGSSMVRYCEAGGKRGSDGRPERWVTERLLSVSERSHTYTILDSCYGVSGYVATLSVVDNGGGGGAGDPAAPPPAAEVVWSYRVHPAPHLFSSPIQCFAFFSDIFQRMMLSLETSLASIYPPPSAVHPH